MSRATIVYNPIARRAPSLDRLRVAARSLEVEGWSIEVRATSAAGDGTRIAAEAALAGEDAVIACGGDGTINEVVNGLAGTDCALGLIRGGMGNVFAKEIGIPRAPERALRLLVDGERRRFDLGRADSRYFLLMAGVGFDARVVRGVPRGAKRLLGSTSHVLWGAIELLRHKPRAARLKIDGADRAAALYWLLLGNTRSYGGVIDITSGARVDDGLLDAYLFAGGGAAWVLSTGVRTALRRPEGAAGVSFHRLRELAISTPGLPVQADGEYFGETPVRFSVAPQALSVILPPGRGQKLFS